MTSEYNREFATVNAMWAAGRNRGFVPAKVYLLAEDPESPRTKRVAAALEAVQEALGAQPSVVAVKILPSNPKHIHESVKGVLDGHTDDAVALDITPGRTVPKLALFALVKHPAVRHLFYLSVAGFDYRDAAYPEIPFPRQRCMDLYGAVTKLG